MDFRLRRTITIVATAAAILAVPARASAQAQFSIVRTFPNAPSAPNSPYGPLIEGTDGNFYGTSSNGGSFNSGTVFKVTPSGDVTVLHEFTGTDGASPSSGLVRGTDGHFYGTTSAGGTAFSGTFFRITADGVFTSLYSFSADQGFPIKRLIEGTDGNFYSSTKYRPPNIGGVVFKISPAGSITIVRPLGAYPPPDFFTLALQAPDGNFYGFTAWDGNFGRGTVFRMTPAGDMTTLHDFSGPDGGDPTNLIHASDGNFYGTTATGGSADRGTVFRMTPAGVLSVVNSFTSLTTTGVSPSDSLLAIGDGSFVGSARAGAGGAMNGAFRIAADGSLSLLHVFDAESEGSGAVVLSFVRAADGKVYGTASNGGAVGRGTVFAMSPGGDVNVLTAFPGDEQGTSPVAIVRAKDGKLYGTTSYGGAANQGTAFSLTPDGSVSWLHAFSASDGPSSTPMIQASDGNLYGTLGDSVGVPSRAFRMTPGGTFTTLHQFDAAEGRNLNGLVEQPDGYFYGTASDGGDSSLGTFFRMAPDGSVTVLYSFSSRAEGVHPGSLVADGGGSFYTTAEAGTAEAPYAKVLRIAADGTVTPVALIYTTVPSEPLQLFRRPALTLARDGNLYGVVDKTPPLLTAVFRITPDGTYTLLGELGYLAAPLGAPVEAPDGNLYGFASSGSGIFYKITPATGSVEIMSTPGRGEHVPRMLTWGGDGYLYGTAALGARGGGAVFRLQVPMPAPMTIDAPMPSQTVVQPFSFSGWALDLGPSPVPGPGVDAVHVWAYPDAGGAPIFAGAASYGVSRPDVAAAFGDRYAHAGYQLNVSGLAPGSYHLVAFAHRTQSGTFDVARSVGITVPQPQPWIVIDAPGADATVGPSFTISGWAIDTAASSGSGIDAVHLYAYPATGAPIFLGIGAYGGSRPDVGAIFGARFTNSAYTLNVSGLLPGAYRLVVFAHSTISGTFSAQIRDITVRAGNPMMFVDAPVTGAVLHPPFEIRGWAVDTDALAGPGVDAIHVWAFSASGTPVFLGAATYGTARPDVAVYLGDSRFTNSGYSLSATGLSPGVWQLVIFARSTVTGTFNQARVVSIAVH